MSKEVKVAVDVGRSQVKVSYGDEGKSFSFPTVLTDAPVVSDFVNLDTGHIREGFTFEGRDYVVGETALKLQSTDCQNYSESSVFHEVSLLLIRYALLRVSIETGCTSFVLAINLTYNNMQNVERYKALKGKHQLCAVIGNSRREVNYEITRLFCFNQGYVSVFNFLNTPEENLVSSKVGLCIDIGCYTLDLTVVDSMTMTRGTSINLGTTSLIKNVCSEAARSGVTLNFFDVERVFHGRSDSKVQSLDGNTFDILECVKKIAPAYALEVVKSIKSYVGSTPFSYLLFVGGGINLVHKEIASLLKVRSLELADRLFANSKGMLRFLQAM